MADTSPPLSELTTLRLGGPASRFLRATSEQQLLDLEHDAADRGEHLLVVAGGSNLVVADEGVPATVLKVETRGVEAESDLCGGALVTVAAGEPWDDFVAHAVAQRWTGIEALSGIPGSVGATPIQNVGAYGQEVSEVVARVRCWDREEKRVTTLTAAECGFGYRTSRFKAAPQKYLVLSVTFQFRQGTLSTPVRYAELADTLGVELGGRASLADVREAVLALRRSKGMVLDPADHDTWSAGSFFTNPFVAAAPEGAPAYAQPDGSVKTSAAWLIENAGFAKGYGSERVALSSKHTLALTNRGGGTTRELLALAEEIQRGVHTSYGIWLVNEPFLVNCTLPDAP